MIKKLLATTAILGTTLGGVVAVAPAASADVVDCRGWTNPDANGVQLNPCWVLPSSDDATINAEIGVITHGRSIDPCAQLVNVNTGQWVVNYGCAGWENTGSSQAWSVLRASLDLVHAPYVVQEGYWGYSASGALQYYDNAQSPVIYF